MTGIRSDEKLPVTTDPCCRSNSSLLTVYICCEAMRLLHTVNDDTSIVCEGGVMAIVRCPCYSFEPVNCTLLKERSHAMRSIQCSSRRCILKTRCFPGVDRVVADSHKPASIRRPRQVAD